MTMPERNSLDTATLLVVDDDKQLRTFCRDCLAGSGFRVLEGEDGLQALLIAASNGGSIDLLITDIELPQVRGTDLGRVFKALWPPVKVLYISGSLNESTGAGPGADGAFLPKPFPPEALVKTVGSILSTHAA